MSLSRCLGSAIASATRCSPIPRPGFVPSRTSTSLLRPTSSLSARFNQRVSQVRMEHTNTGPDISSLTMATETTPPFCIADFCLVPIGTGSPSVSSEVAEIQKVIEKCGLKYCLHSAGTTIEGPWNEVFKVIGQCHKILHDNGVLRVQTDVRVGTRTDKSQSMTDKVDKVNKLLGKE